LLVVLTIVSVLVMSISYVMLRKPESLNSIAAGIAQNLRLVRQQAIRDDQPYQVVIDVGNNALHFFDETVELSGDISLTVKTAQNQVIDNAIVGMTFYPDASSSGGLITLENDREVVEISVIWISGKIQTRHQPRAG
jgi:Tfp pilus assembly protein FimT